MSITIEIPTALRRLTAGTPRVVCSVANLGELFSELDSQFPDLKPHLRDEAGETRRFLNIYVNEEDIRFLGGAAYSFQDGDEVELETEGLGRLRVRIRDDLKRTWERDTWLERRAKQLPANAVRQLSGKYGPNRNPST